MPISHGDCFKQKVQQALMEAVYSVLKGHFPGLSPEEIIRNTLKIEYTLTQSEPQSLHCMQRNTAYTIVLPDHKAELLTQIKTDLSFFLNDEAPEIKTCSTETRGDFKYLSLSPFIAYRIYQFKLEHRDPIASLFDSVRLSYCLPFTEHPPQEFEDLTGVRPPGYSVDNPDPAPAYTDQQQDALSANPNGLFPPRPQKSNAVLAMQEAIISEGSLADGPPPARPEKSEDVKRMQAGLN